MKKVKFIGYAAGFVVALSASFAFKPTASPNAIAYLKNPAPFCMASTTLCNGGTAACVISGQQAYWDQGVCSLPATKH